MAYIPYGLIYQLMKPIGARDGVDKSGSWSREREWWKKKERREWRKKGAGAI
jgi:hypothetical protein